MPETTPSPALTVDDLDLLCDRFRSGTAVRATTPHGTHVFDLVGIEEDEQGRVLLRLAPDESKSTERLPHADVPGLTPETCPEREAHGNPFRMCPVKGCGWHEGMAT